jgi:transposase
MRGGDVRTEGLFSYVSCESRVPKQHPLRHILSLVDAALADLSAEFARLYAPIGRPSIPPEKLLRALLLQAFYSVRSERQLMEQLDYNLLFRWFTGLGLDDPVWDVMVFTKNRDRLHDGDIAAKFFRAVLSQPEVRALLSDEHFSVDGTLIEAFASMKSFKPKGDHDGPPAGGGRNAERDFHGEKRTNQTHTSTTDPDARLFRKGPRQGGQALPHGPPADGEPERADRRRPADAGHRHRRARGGRSHAGPPGGRHRATLGADRGYDAASFVATLRALNVAPHIAQNTSRRSAIDGRTTRHSGYVVSQRVR